MLDESKQKKLEVIYASDYKCVKCRAQAEVFWPCIDPDIKNHPYCRDCQIKLKEGLFSKLNNLEKNVHSEKEN